MIIGGVYAASGDRFQKLLMRCRLRRYFIFFVNWMMMITYWAYTCIINMGFEKEEDSMTLMFLRYWRYAVRET